MINIVKYNSAENPSHFLRKSRHLAVRLDKMPWCLGRLSRPEWGAYSTSGCYDNCLGPSGCISVLVPRQTPSYAHDRVSWTGPRNFFWEHLFFFVSLRPVWNCVVFSCLVAVFISSNSKMKINTTKMCDFTFHALYGCRVWYNMQIFNVRSKSDV